MEIKQYVWQHILRSGSGNLTINVLDRPGLGHWARSILWYKKAPDQSDDLHGHEQQYVRIDDLSVMEYCFKR